MDKRISPGNEMIKANLLLDSEGQIVCFDSQFPLIWKILSPTSIKGTGISFFFNEHDRFPSIMEKISKDAVWSGQLQAVDGNGTHFTVHSEYNLIKNNNGESLYIACKCVPDDLEILLITDDAPSTCALNGLQQKTIMLVEDDDSVRVVVHSMLELMCHQVISSDNGQTALTISDSYEGKIDILLTDMLMPIMNGRELAVSISSKRPELRVIFMSGYHDNRWVNKDADNVSGSPFLQKPFTAETLTRAVQGVIEGESPA